MLRLNAFMYRSANLYIRRSYSQSKKRDHYEVLGVTKEATAGQIKRAYYKLAQEYHPDKNKAPDAHARFVQINKANEILSNPTKRERYNDHPLQQEKVFTSNPMYDFWSDLFGMSIQRKVYEARAGNIYPSKKCHHITWFQSLSGCKKVKEFDRLMLCLVCNGNRFLKGGSILTCSKCKGKMKIKTFDEQGWENQTPCTFCNKRGFIIFNQCETCKGSGYFEQQVQQTFQIGKKINENQQIVLQGKGDFGGNLIIELFIKKYSFYKRVGNDAFMDLQISVFDAILGAQKHIYDPQQEQLILYIEKRIHHNSKIQVKKKGYKYDKIIQGSDEKQAKRGNIIFTIKIVYPNFQKAEEIQQLERMREIMKQAEKYD